MSSKKDVLSGVPQGTVLGPLLFLTYINDFPDCITSSVTKLFADDSLLLREIRNQQDADCFQKDLTALEEWEKKMADVFSSGEVYYHQSIHQQKKCD